jgi:hypothetical protein
MSVAAVSHFVEDAIDNGVDRETVPTVSSWINDPLAATMRTIPPDNPAERTRCWSRESVRSNAPGGMTFSVVVVAAAVVGTDDGIDVRVEWPAALVVADPQPAATNPVATDSTNHRERARPSALPRLSASLRGSTLH